MSSPSYSDVVNANVAVFDTLASTYNETEPHFSPDNQARVKARLKLSLDQSGGSSQEGRLLDVGCGTGFMIDQGRELFSEIHGVDISKAMLAQVNREGPAAVTTHLSETGTMEVPQDYFHVATAYSFLHHLQDIGPTLKKVWDALRPGGCFYADLEPNGYFLKSVSELDVDGSYDAVVERELEQIHHKDQEIAKRLNVPTGTFQSAEYGKVLKGGFFEESLREEFLNTGFSKVDFDYQWFIGEGTLVNDPKLSADQRIKHTQIVDEALRKALPLTRHLFKYMTIRALK